MHTIEEEPEEYSDEVLLRNHQGRESISTVRPRNRIRSLGSGWIEAVTPSGRLFYYNSDTKEKSWKPPRRCPRGISDSNIPPRSCFPSREDSRSSEWKSPELGPEPLPTSDPGVKPTNVGKILRTGVLKTRTFDVSSGKFRKKWVKSFVVLTEFFLLLTTVVGSFQKLFKKTKTPTPSRYYLVNAEVVKNTEVTNHRNVYRLKTPSSEILFRSKNSTVAESWYQVLALVIDNLKHNNEKYGQLDFKLKQRSHSFDWGVCPSEKKMPALPTTSTSLSDFGVEETAAKMPNSKCLSDFFGPKYATPAGWITVFDAETEQFCYVNCITKKKWFRTKTDDGHPYFYEEGCNRRAWLLPSIYLDVNSQVLEDFRKSIGSHKSLQSIT